MDLQNVQADPRARNIQLSDDELSGIEEFKDLCSLKSGTLVVWQHLDRMQAGTIDFSSSMGKQIDIVREHLSLIYHRYLTGEPGLKKIIISINGEDVIPADPFMMKKSDKTMQEETYLIRGETIKVQPYLLPHFSKMSASEIKAAGGKEGLRKLQGFYVYRNKRLIVWGTWFRMMRKSEVSKLARIRVDIPNTLDDLWTLDIKKSSAMPPEEVRVNLGSVIDKLANKSKEKYTRRGKLETADNEIHIWDRMKDRDGGFYYQINRKHPLIKRLEDEMGGNTKLLYAVLKQIEVALPLNQLFIDLTSDEHISNDEAQDKKEIEKAVWNMLDTMDTSDQKISYLEQLKSISPFSKNQSVMDKIEKELNKNE